MAQNKWSQGANLRQNSGTSAVNALPLFELSKSKHNFKNNNKLFGNSFGYSITHSLTPLKDVKIQPGTNTMNQF